MSILEAFYPFRISRSLLEHSLIIIFDTLEHSFINTACSDCFEYPMN
jgi:hypothetical protein